jgi:hypothetical protein
LVGVLGRWEIVADPDGWPFTPLGLVSCGHDDVGMILVGELVNCGQDGVGAVRVDEVDEGLKVAACRIVGRVVLYFAPGGEEDEFGVACAAAFLEVASR